MSHIMQPGEGIRLNGIGEWPNIPITGTPRPDPVHPDWLILGEAYGSDVPAVITQMPDGWLEDLIAVAVRMYARQTAAKDQRGT